MFREGRQLSTWLRFGLHFGSILGAQVATILLFGRPGVQIGCPEARLNFNDFFAHFQGGAGSWASGKVRVIRWFVGPNGGLTIANLPIDNCHTGN